MSLDWGELFGLTVPPLEMVVRGTAMYFFLFLLFRVVIKRRVGSIGMADILVLVIVADAAQNGMAAQYNSLTNGIVLVATIIGMSTLLDWVGQRIPAVEEFIHPAPRQLIDDGRFVKARLSHELMTEDEMMSQLRLQGVEHVEDVKASYLEGTGEVSVIKKDQSGDSGRRRSVGGK